MSFILRHKFTYFTGFLFGILNFFFFKFIPRSMDDVMGAVVTLDLILAVIFMGFCVLLLEIHENKLFKSLFLDLKVIDSITLGITFCALLSFISLIGFFITTGKNLFMSIWFTLLGLLVGIIILLIIQLFEILHGLWVQRQNNNDLF